MLQHPEPLAEPEGAVQGSGRARILHGLPWRLRSVGSLSVSSRTVYVLGDQIVYSFGNMVVAAMLSRHSSAWQFGVYILTQRAMDVLIQLSNAFLWMPLTFALPGLSGERRARYQGSIVLLQSILCLLFAGFLGALTLGTKGQEHASLHAAFGPLVVASGGILFREFTRRMYFAHLRITEAFWTDAATVALQIAGVAWLYRTGQLTVPFTLGVLCAGAALVSLWWLVSDWKHWTVDLRLAFTDLSRDLRMGRWLCGANLVALASAQWNPWMLNAMLGSAAVGTYSVCESLVNIPRAALSSMQNVMGPVVARAHLAGGVSGMRDSVQKINRVQLVASVTLAGVLMLIAPLGARLIYGRSPDHTRWIVCVLALNLVAFVSTLAQTYGLMSLGRADLTFYANLAGMVLQTCVAAMMVRSFHIVGAAGALLVGSVAVLIVRQIFFSWQITASAPSTELHTATEQHVTA